MFRARMLRPVLAPAALAIACLLAPACSWVPLEKSAADVLVLPPARLPADCTSRGTVRVSVVEKVGVLARHESEVIEDLDVLARNHAANQGGDTVVPRSPVEDGARRYEIFRCLETGTAETNKPRQTDSPDVEVLPYGE